MKNRIQVLALFAALSLPSVAAPLFPDVPDNHWARDAVAALAAKGLVEGYPDGTFKGDRAASRWETAMIVARLLARMEQEHATFATRAELEELRKLVDALREELQALGVRVDNLEENVGRLDKRVSELERITFYGRSQTVIVSQHFYNQGAIQSPPYLRAGGGPAAQARPQTQGVFPVVDYVRARPLTSGTGFTSRATLGVKIKASDDVDVRAEFVGFTAQGDEFVDVYYGASAPNPVSLITGTANEPHFPFTRMVLDRVQVDHKPSRTRLILGSYDSVLIDPLLYTGQPNLSIFPPSRYVGYGFQVQGSTEAEKVDRLVWEAFGSRYGEGNIYQGLDYRHNVLGGDLAYEFDEARGRVKLQAVRLLDEAPDGQPLLTGLIAATNVQYGASTGWTPTQWVNPPGFFAADRPGPQTLPVAPGDPNPFIPNVVDTRPIPGWNPFTDNAKGLTAGGGDYGPGGQNTYGIAAKYKFDFGLRVLGEYAKADFKSNRNSPYTSHGSAYRFELGGEVGDFDLNGDYIHIDPDYNPALYANGALGRRAPITLQVGGRFFLHDNSFYPHNREGVRVKVTHKFEENASWYLAANLLRQTRTSLYDVRSPANSLGPANPNFAVIGFSPGFIDPIFYGYAHPNLYGKNSMSSFTAALDPLEDNRGYETMLGGGINYGPLALFYENRHFTRATQLPAALGGSQNYVNMYTQYLSANTTWPLREDVDFRAGFDYVRAKGHMDPAGLYNFFAVANNSVNFTNLDSSQFIPTLGFDYRLSDKVSWGVTGRYYMTKDHVSTALGTGTIGHPFDWTGPQLISEFRVEF